MPRWCASQSVRDYGESSLSIAGIFKSIVPPGSDGLRLSLLDELAVNPAVKDTPSEVPREERSKAVDRLEPLERLARASVLFERLERKSELNLEH